MRLALVAGLVILMGCSAAQPWQGIQQEGVAVRRSNENVPEDIKKIRREIQRYHDWLESRRRLLSPPLHYKGCPKRRQLDPETLKPLLVPEPIPSTAEEIIKELNRMLRDPTFRKWQKKQREDPDNLVRCLPEARPQRPYLGGLGLGRLT